MAEMILFIGTLEDAQRRYNDLRQVETNYGFMQSRYRVQQTVWPILPLQTAMEGPEGGPAWTGVIDRVQGWALLEEMRRDLTQWEEDTQRRIRDEYIEAATSRLQQEEAQRPTFSHDPARPSRNATAGSGNRTQCPHRARQDG